MARTSYHHGDLRAAILAGAARLAAERGVDGLSMRELAREAGVSHAAPAHHFGDRRGLLTALATEGLHGLADALDAAPTFLDAAVAYVRFALDHPGHFAVMFAPAVVDGGDVGLQAAEQRTAARLTAGVESVSGDGDGSPAWLAAWSLVHGLATLMLAGAVSRDDAEEQTRTAARVLFPERP